MGRRRSTRSRWQWQFDELLSFGVRPVLKARGFAKSHYVFRRNRGSMYDMIGFQGNWHNNVTPWHGFFINVGVGSREVDATWPGPVPAQPNGFLLDRRWESLIPDAPYELRFNHTTDMEVFTEYLCSGLEEVVDVIDEFDCTAKLVRYAIDNNRLIAYERTCCYLAATDNEEMLIEYVSQLRRGFGPEGRWEIFAQRISELTGHWAPELTRRGLLDPVVDTVG